jgi:rare lipoprotein A
VLSWAVDSAFLPNPGKFLQFADEVASWIGFVRALVVGCLLAGVICACAAATPSPDTELARGKATWYGAKFHGRRTSSGERFDMNALTAAHESLPFGTRVRVRNLANGREVVVRINDRAPHVADRVIDLSKAAAAALGILKAGAASVVLLED